MAALNTQDGEPVPGLTSLSVPLLSLEVWTLKNFQFSRPW